MIHYQEVDYLDIAEIEQLVSHSKDEGFNHLQKLVDDYKSGANRFDKPGECLMVALSHNHIVGVCGINRDPFQDRMGRLRRLYVAPQYRNLGIARNIVTLILNFSVTHYQMVNLKISNINEAGVDAFYKSLGFVRVDSETATHQIKL
ncbi:GNAT family N-acetyltransferase [Erysipelothrix sp. HDW6C]|uniref:GNAT family N-acetyltransferase n=1 Tax=Erysipelothrix sp. HDW6C TaxID=2714930 RepID=UPI0014080A8F|nr:GNAT family N-acetyltransferase [Erysipelothrix sp. HDW6C]QIK69920.1 GNAT family N-acetyltransferase [Erysipelothrix sp. HDW6C]